MPFSFANPWGLLGLLSLPAIVVIHMYHHRYPPLLIAGSNGNGPQSAAINDNRQRMISIGNQHDLGCPLAHRHDLADDTVAIEHSLSDVYRIAAAAIDHESLARDEVH